MWGNVVTKPMNRLSFFVAIAIACVGLTSCDRVKTRLDREVDRLCSIDGGVQVYEVIELSKEDFGADGEVFSQYRKFLAAGGSLGPDYVWRSTSKIIVTGDPSLTRREESITRVKDRKLLGRRVVYVRGGGDWLGPWVSSSYSCQGVPLDLVRIIFVKRK